MSKFSVRALADALSAELAASGISVTHIAPGFIESEIRRVDRRGGRDQETRDPIPSFLVMRADVAAKQMADAVEARRPEAVVTLHGKAAAFLAQRFPRSMQSVARLAAKRIVATRKSPL
jgi:short-subunit dehydrogenase